MCQAVLIGDNHVCPKCEGSKPHVGGPILGPPDGSRLLIAGRPISVVGDKAFCVGPPDEIVAVIEGILVADKLVADGNAKTDHGGTIIATGSVLFG
jgi:uncharacterized Zn-binding protein involved in type VI secretion